MSRILESHTLEQRYFERMAQSIGDKIRIIQHLPRIVDPLNPPKVLDVGAGGGEFALELVKLGYKVTVLDANEDAIEQLYRYNNLETIHALANQTSDFGENVYDAIVCSSVLHEVFSYGDNVHRRGHISSIGRAVDSFREALKPGGVLVIRDGVLPDNWESKATVQLLDGHESSAVNLYLKMCPFANGEAYGKQGTLINLEEIAPKLWEGNVHSVLEFAYTYTWGLDSYHRETQELYTAMTLEGYSDYLEERGFTVTEKYSYLQPGYPEHLAYKMLLEVEGEPHEWFDSNAIWVAVKN